MWVRLALVSGVLAVLVIAAVVIVVLMTASDDKTTVADVTVGDCLAQVPDRNRVTMLEAVSCGQAHHGEVIAVLTMPDGDFPGGEAVVDYQRRCHPELAGYAPAAANDPAIGMFALAPTEESWAQGDRRVTCIATSDHARSTGLA